MKCLRVNSIQGLATSLVLSAAIFAAPTALRATLLAYEGFDYVAGQSIIGQNPASGYGFSTGWLGNSGVGTNNDLVLAGSFTYTDSFGNSIVSSGNRALVTGNGVPYGGNTGNGQPYRNLTFGRGTNSVIETTWISVIATRVGEPYPYTNSAGVVANYGRAAQALTLFYQGAAGNTNQGSEMVGLGRASENTTGIDLNHTMDSWQLFNAGTAAQSVSSDVGFVSLPADFLLWRIDHVVGTTATNYGDTAYVWINPQNLAKEPSLAKADMVFTPTSVNTNNNRDYIFNQIRMFGGSSNGTVGYGAIEVDEIRIGTEFLDVTLRAIPEPPVFALGALAGLALLAIRKLNQQP